MLLSKQQQFIFIHIYKNAGTSITRALMPFAANKWQMTTVNLLSKINISLPFGPQVIPYHITSSELIDKMGRDTFDSFFTFAIVRNPWDWQVSLYKYMLKNKRHHQHDFIKKLGSFDEYIKWRCTKEVRFQKDFVCSKEGDFLVDFIGRFENIDTDFQIICSRIGISASLPKLNISNTRSYQEFYNKESRELVHQAFDADIILFGYEF